MRKRDLEKQAKLLADQLSAQHRANLAAVTVRKQGHTVTPTKVKKKKHG